MVKRQGYELVIGDRWLFVGPKHEFPDGPEVVEIADLQRGEVRIQFLEGRLAGKLEWHSPGRLFAPIGEVENVRQHLHHEQLVAEAALSEVEEWAVLTAGSAFGEELLPGKWKWGSNAERVAALLDVPLHEVVSVPLAQPLGDGTWRLPGRHQLYLARKLSERYPGLVHDYATTDVDRLLRNWDVREHEPPPVYRAAHLLVCSWCHVAPDCDRLEVLQRQRAEIEWLFSELRRAVERLGDISPQTRGAALRRIRDHYHLDKNDRISPSWPGLP